jgi:hypothetical protein
MEVQHGRRLTHNDRKHCWRNIDTAAVACLLGYFTTPARRALSLDCRWRQGLRKTGRSRSAHNRVQA